MKLGELLLMWDNNRSHAVKETQVLMINRNIELVKEPAYSPSLNLCDMYLFKSSIYSEAMTLNTMTLNAMTLNAMNM